MPPGRALAWLILAATAFRLVMAVTLGLGIDESYVVAAGRQFHLGYFDHPPLVWWLSQGAARVAGSEAAWVVRLPFIGLAALSTWLMYRLAAGLYTPRTGLWAAAGFTLAPVLGVTTGGWVLPDGPLVCALLAAACCLVRALPGRTGAGGGWGWWLGAGLCAGLALLSKYTAGLVLVGALIGIATQPAHRHWLARPQPYVAALLALLVFSPELIWNAQHHWASFAFQGGRADTRRFRPFGPLATLGGEALFLLPWIWLGLMGAFWRGLRAGPAEWRGWLLCWLAAVPIGLFAVVSFWTGVLFHWAAPGYLFLFPLLGATLENWRPARLWAAGTAALLCCALLATASELRWHWIGRIAPNADPALQALDWTPLRAALAARGLLSGAIAGPDWASTGKIAYALGPTTQVFCLNADSREFAYGPTPAGAIGQNILIVAPRLTAAQIAARYGGLFTGITPLAPAIMAFAHRPAVALPLFVGHDLRRWPPAN
jgi:4-amino-4-deoxy-L-arabinose transferase-like glycosyltransferase